MAEKRRFEQSMEELEGVVRRLEGGQLTLDESLAAFEQGVKLTRECESMLSEAKGKIEQLIKDAQGNAAAASFEVKG
ncbi:MAG: exodeoxyribonuclease VII small subunit [bacterium]